MSSRQQVLSAQLNQMDSDGTIAPDLKRVITYLASSCVEVGQLVERGAITGTLGASGATNVQGEAQKEMDVIANDVFVAGLSNCAEVAAFVSEELDDIVWQKQSADVGDLVVYFDPLDGSSNLGVNMCVGSIFSIVRLSESVDHADERKLLKSGRHQIAAGFSVYGPATSLVLTCGKGVGGYTFDRMQNQFVLTHPDMSVPDQTNEYGINSSRESFWDAPMARYVRECVEGEHGPRNKSFGMRWTASMVADVYRVLIRGGTFMYPVDQQNRETGGKLRLLYEGNPMGWIVEQAGGIASTGTERILDVEPLGPHQRVSVILGSAEEVERIESYYGEET